MLPSKSRSGLYESASINRGRPSTPSSGNRPSTPASGNNRPSTPASGNNRPSTPASNKRPSTPRGSDASNMKSNITPPTPRARKAGSFSGSLKSDPNSPSQAQNARPRLSFERSPTSVDSKTRTKIGTIPDLRRLNGSEMYSELEAKLGAVQEELKKSKDQLTSVEGEKKRILEELHNAKLVADETNEKLQEALMAKRWAEEATEIEKFRADELEQSGIDAAQKREEDWQREIERFRSQHAADLGTLVNATEELERARHEVAMADDAKNAALVHADDAMKIAEMHAKKLELLSGEVARLKTLLDSSMDSKARETDELVKKLDSAKLQLESELQSTRSALESKVRETEEIVKMLESAKLELEAELENARSAAKSKDREAEELVKKLECQNSELKGELENTRASAESKAQETEELVKKLECQNSELKGELEIAKTAAQSKAQETDELVKKLEAENLALKDELESARSAEEAKEREIDELVKRWESENIELKAELENARAAEQKLDEMEKLVKDLRSALADAKKAESNVSQLMEEWKEKAESLEVKLEEATLSEKFKTDSLASAMKELEETSALLHDKESEISMLRGKMEALDIEVARLKAEVNESNQRLDAGQQEMFELQSTVDVLKTKLQSAEVTTSEALSNEKIATMKIESLSEEKDWLIGELEATKDEGEKDKKAMEDLAAALHEASAKARESHERSLKKEADYEHALAQIGDLKLALKNTKESYEVMLDEANYEIVCLRKTIEKLEAETKDYKEESDFKEINFVNSNRQSAEEITALKVEADKVLASLRGAEHEVQAAKEEKVQLQDKLMHVESVVAEANKAIEKAKTESLQMMESMLDKENALQVTTRENDDLRMREADAMKKINELTALLAEAKAKRQTERNEEQFDVEKERSRMQEAIDSHTSNGTENGAEQPKAEVEALDETSNGNLNHNEENVENNAEREVQAEVGRGNAKETEKKVLEKELPADQEREAESVDSESKSIDHANGILPDGTEKATTSPIKQQQKKNKPLLKKFGSLLKKKNSQK